MNVNSNNSSKNRAASTLPTVPNFERVHLWKVLYFDPKEINLETS